MRTVVLAAVAAAALTVVAPGATAAPERTATVQAGETFSWKDAAEINANPFYFAQVPQQPDVAPIEQGKCTGSAHQSCDEILVELVNPLTQSDLDKGKTSKVRSVTIDINEYAPVAQVTDFDLQVFASDATGVNKGFFTGSQTTSQSGELIGASESLAVDVTTSAANPSTYMLIRVIRYFSPNASYKGTISF